MSHPSHPSLPPVCLLAGGLGSRLGEHVRSTPKPLLEVGGRPFLTWILALLARHRAHDVVLCVGYLGEQIEAIVGDGSAWGLRIRTVYDGPDLRGTAGAVRGALEHLGDRFLVLYGDTYLRIDYAAVDRAHRDSGAPALMTVLHNAGRWDTSNVEYADGRVLAYDKVAPAPSMAWIDYGLSVLTPAALEAAPRAPDLADAFHALAARGELAGYEATERFYEIGTPAALAETEQFLASGGRA